MAKSLIKCLLCHTEMRDHLYWIFNQSIRTAVLCKKVSCVVHLPRRQIMILWITQFVPKHTASLSLCCVFFKMNSCHISQLIHKKELWFKVKIQVNRFITLLAAPLRPNRSSNLWGKFSLSANHNKQQNNSMNSEIDLLSLFLIVHDKSYVSCFSFDINQMEIRP